MASPIAALAASPVPPAHAARAAAAPASTASPSTDTSSQSPPPVNPSVHLDLTSNLVVLQFFNAQGDVTQSIPSEKQLQAYREGEPDRTGPASTQLSV